MEALYAILGIAAIVIIVILYRKGVNAGAKALNQKVIFKKEYQQQQQLIKESLTFSAKTSPENIAARLTARVSPQRELPAAFASVIYELSRSPGLITYALGNKAYPKLFVAAVSLKQNGETTAGVFEFIKWSTRSGMLLDDDKMKELRNQVVAAFTDADPNVRISGIPSKVTQGETV